MPSLPSEFLAVILPYAGLFCRRVFAHVQLLLAGAILAPGKRTITSVLRILGRQHERCFSKYHRVLSQAHWSARAAGRVLLTQLVAVFAGAGPVLVGLDETLERRWGAQIAARGIYRDAVRSRRDHFVTCSGLRWISVVLLAPIPWAGRVWALPFALGSKASACQQAARQGADGQRSCSPYGPCCRTSTQRMGTGGLPAWYHRAVSVATSTARSRPRASAGSTRACQTVGAWVATWFSRGRRAPLRRGRPRWPAGRGGTGAYSAASSCRRVMSVT